MKNDFKMNWFKNNPFFNNYDEYNEFANEMKAAAQDGMLPICLKHEDPYDLTMNDFKNLSYVFEKDTGLNIEFQIITCRDCGRLHCHLIITE